MYMKPIVDDVGPIPTIGELGGGYEGDVCPGTFRRMPEEPREVCPTTFRGMDDGYERLPTTAAGGGDFWDMAGGALSAGLGGLGSLFGF